MLAAVLTRFGGPDALEVRDVPTPNPGPGEVLVRVSAAGMNNTDIWTREGAYGLPGDPDALAGWRGPLSFPRIQGGDIAGTVDGRRVLVDPAHYDAETADANPVGLMGSETDGGFAQFVVAPANRVHDVTESPLDDAELAALPIAYGTAMGMLERGDVRGGETVLVTGASGGVGLALVRLAAARGARVLALTSAGKEKLVTEAGADVTIDRATTDLPAAIRDAAPGGLDAVADVVGGDVLAETLPSVSDGGRWIVAGALGGHTVPLDLRRLYLHNVALIGSSMHTPAQFDRLVAEARRGTIRPRVAARYDLAEIHAAQAEFVRRAHVGKLVLTPPDA